MTVAARSGALVLVLMLGALIAAPIAQAACPKTSLPVIQEEVMCLICGVPLVNAAGPQAEDEREFIRGLVNKCQSKEQIKTALINEYGEGVIAVPTKSGFDLTAYLVPVIGGLLALIAVIVGALDWRRARNDEVSGGEAVSPESAAELDKDFQRYDL